MIADEQRRYRIRPLANLPFLNAVQRAIGIDGGYVRLAGRGSGQDGWFEVIVRKSLREDGAHAASHTFIHSSTSPPIGVLTFLAQECVRANQPVTFLSVGDDTARGPAGF
ncbi:hypothetical protein AWB74_08096 [Caballeronia arvi]|uniref:Uncharacterized protein n=1 Tax=Caballeronia arvi TaxID=1777135 RepID=A0A158L3G0_9BURK|nr:hypothetical protein AWB74_08096 [Caballeronia arvi]